MTTQTQTRSERRRSDKVERKEIRQQMPDGEIIVNFHEGQQRVYDSTARFIMMLSGTQSGKTSFGPHWLHREITDVFHALKLGPGQPLGDFIAATSTYDQFKLKMLPELIKVFVDLLGIGHYWGQEKIIELRENLDPNGRFWTGLETASKPMWGRIILRSGKSVAGLVGLTAWAAWLDELGQDEFSYDAWLNVTHRLALASDMGFGRILGTTTLYNMGWLKREIYDRWQDGDPNIEVIQFESVMNPAYPEEEFERNRQTMPEWLFNMMHRGQYDKPAGLVYQDFDDMDIVKPMPIPDNWFWHIGHDFGIANPGALAYAQAPESGIYFLVHESLPGPLAVHEHITKLADMMGKRAVEQTLIRKGGNHTTEEGWREAYTKGGWPIAEPIERSVPVGINRIHALHKVHKIKVFNTCKRYLDEKYTYSYKIRDGVVLTDDIRDQARYHLMDAERYLLGDVSLNVAGKGPSQRHRWGHRRRQRRERAEMLE